MFNDNNLPALATQLAYPARHVTLEVLSADAQGRPIAGSNRLIGRADHMGRSDGYRAWRWDGDVINSQGRLVAA